MLNEIKMLNEIPTYPKYGDISLTVSKIVMNFINDVYI